MRTDLKLLCFLCFLLGQTATAGTWSMGRNNGIYGLRNYKVYVPSNLPKSPAIVVMLHGCEQSADEFAKGTKIAAFADKEKFIALLPEQNTAYNPFKCWNWVVPANNTRSGEPEVIVQMIDEVVEKYHADEKNVFAAGMSAGASMVSILGNCYPERFKALASHDGTQYYASYNGLDFAEVVLNGASVPATVAARTGYNCSFLARSERPKKMPIIIFHGMNSPLMSPVHAFQIENEYKAFNDLLDDGKKNNSYFKSKDVKDVPDSKTYGYNLYTTVDQDDDILIERYMINNLSHNWSGGTEGMPYNDPKGPDATSLIIKFFHRYGL